MGAAPAPDGPGGGPLLEISGLRTWFHSRAGEIHAVDGVDLAVQRGEVLGLVVESGSGKSVTMLSVLRLVDKPGRIASGRVTFDGIDLTALARRELRAIRGNRISMVFQQPNASLHPCYTAGHQISEVYEIHRNSRRKAGLEKAVEMLRSGITTVNDMSYHRHDGSLASLGAADGLEEMGMRGQLSYGASDVSSYGAADAYEDPVSVDSLIAEHEALADRVADSQALGFRCGLGSVLGTTQELFERTVAACNEHGWGVHTHLSEVREELTGSRIAHGHTTIEEADRQGLLDLELLAAHCIWCSERDIGLLVSRDVKVCHNPVANMILASGVCPVPRLRSSGVAVGLGTDGAASNDNQDMFGVLKAAGLIHKLHALDAAAISARDVIQMATIDGARALNLDSITGSLEPGKRADVVLLDGNTPELATIHDPWQQVVYCATARCVSDVWVDGRRRVADGEVVDADVKALAAEARAAGADLATRAGLTSESKLARSDTVG